MLHAGPHALVAEVWVQSPEVRHALESLGLKLQQLRLGLLGAPGPAPSVSCSPPPAASAAWSEATHEGLGGGGLLVTEPV